MHDRVTELIRRLALEPHPEGGLFRRTFRSGLAVRSGDDRGSRAALTAIYFLLVDRGLGRWHRVRSDEAWHWLEGAPLALHVAPAEGGAIVTHTLGPLAPDAAPQCVVPAGCWQAAQCGGDYTLVGCCVAPGFDFDDFALLAALPPGRRPAFSPPAMLEQFL